jgi:hypothetical protein
VLKGIRLLTFCSCHGIVGFGLIDPLARDRFHRAPPPSKELRGRIGRPFVVDDEFPLDFGQANPLQMTADRPDESASATFTRWRFRRWVIGCSSTSKVRRSASRRNRS